MGTGGPGSEHVLALGRTDIETPHTYRGPQADDKVAS